MVSKLATRYVPQNHAALNPRSQVALNLIESAYSEEVYWKHSIFMIPSGKAGQLFVRELANSYAVPQHLNVCYTVSASSEATCQELGKRTLYSLGKMKLWQNGDIDTLLHEGRSTCSLQSRLMTLRVPFQLCRLQVALVVGRVVGPFVPELENATVISKYCTTLNNPCSQLQ